MKTTKLFLMVCYLFFSAYGCKNEEKTLQTANDLFISQFGNKNFEQFAPLVLDRGKIEGKMFVSWFPQKL